MATMAGVLFVMAFLLAPERGLVALARRRAQQRAEFAQRMLATHLLHHEGGPSAEVECREDHLEAHLRWTPEFVRRVVGRAERVVQRDGDRLRLTATGRAAAQRSTLE